MVAGMFLRRRKTITDHLRITQYCVSDNAERGPSQVRFFSPLQWNFLVYACFILKNTFICLGEEIILQSIFSKGKKKKRIFQITRKIYKIFFKGETKCKKGIQMQIKWNNWNNGKKWILQVCRLTLHFLSHAQFMYILIIWFSSASRPTWPCEGSSFHASPLIRWNLNRNTDETHQ